MVKVRIVGGKADPRSVPRGNLTLELDILFLTICVSLPQCEACAGEIRGGAERVGAL